MKAKHSSLTRCPKFGEYYTQITRTHERVVQSDKREVFVEHYHITQISRKYEVVSFGEDTHVSLVDENKVNEARETTYGIKLEKNGIFFPSYERAIDYSDRISTKPIPMDPNAVAPTEIFASIAGHEVGLVNEGSSTSLSTQRNLNAVSRYGEYGSAAGLIPHPVTKALGGFIGIITLGAQIASDVHDPELITKRLHSDTYQQK